MFKRISLAVAPMLAVLALSSTAAAQSGPVVIGISGGPSFPTGAFADEATTGYHVQGSVGLNLPLLPFGLRADLLWQDFQDEHEGTFTEVGGIANALLELPFPILTPYIIAGAGVFNHRGPEATHGDHTHGGENSTAAGFNVGAGVAFPFVGLGGVLEARYVDAGNGHRSIPVSVGIRF